ncbi:putative transporter SVOPL [Uranotaenia lowii]|uniref:putative transporter SVOPL n=1 Tax=Uranotaenia lowii TaxID=190385 RepID=UPI00247A5C47|nr:putative transporter SVOPL [Uranotaenia lowii]
MATTARTAESSSEPENTQIRVTFDDAISAAKFGRFNYWLILISAVILTAALLESIGISYVIAVLDCDLQLTTKDKGVLSAVTYVGIIISSHMWGFLADTQGRRKVMIPTLLMAATSTIISSFMPNFWSITFFRLLTGIFVSGSSATIYAYLGEFHSRQNGSRAIMAASFIFSVHLLLIPVVAFLTINREWSLETPFFGVVYCPWRLFVAICSIPSLVGALALSRMPESPKFVSDQGDEKTALAIIHRIHRINSRSKEKPLAFQHILPDSESGAQKLRLSKGQGIRGLSKLIWEQTAPLFRQQFLRKTAFVCVIQFGTFYIAHGTFMFFPTILDALVRSKDAGVQNSTICEVYYSSTSNSSTVTQECSAMLETQTYGWGFVLEIVYAIGFIIIGAIISRIKRSLILAFVCICCGAAAIALVQTNNAALNIALYMLTVMCGYNVSVVSSITVDFFPTHLRAMAVCISMMFGRLGCVVGANVTGALLDHNCELTFGLSGSILLACAVFSLFMPKIAKQLRPTNDITEQS